MQLEAESDLVGGGGVVVADDVQSLFDLSEADAEELMLSLSRNKKTR